MKRAIAAPIRNGAASFTLIGLLLVASAGRLVQIELRDGPGLRAKAEQQQRAVIPIPAQRGGIFDTKGRELAGTVRRPSVFVDPTLVADPHFAACTIAPILGLNAAELEAQLIEKHERHFMWVKRELTDAEAAAFERIRGARSLKAFVLRHEPKRQYLNGRLASHVIGFVGDEQKGLAGIEQEFNELLSGHDGRRCWTVDETRNCIQEREGDYVAPQDGGSVVLTIDAYLQSCTERHLAEAVEGYKAEWGVAVVMDPQSGEVLAMATCPDFSPEEPIPSGLSGPAQAAAREKLLNRPVAGAYEPGSMFKPFIVACALEDKLAHFGEMFVINGPTRQFGSRTIHDTHTYGTLSLEEVIAKSSNIGMGILGERLGNARLHEYVRRFGFGDPTGITLPGEHDGLVQDFSRWGPFSTNSVPIGQEVAITPIQLTTAFSVFCNGGILYRPRVVRGVLAADGHVIEDLSRPIPVRRVISEQTAYDLRMKALVEVVLTGTARHTAQLTDYQVFGKTGTAQVAGPSGHGYQSGKYMGAFIGGAPSDYPRVVALVQLYKPSSGQYYGGTVSAPAVSEILGDAMKYLQVPPETGMRTPRQLTRAADD